MSTIAKIDNFIEEWPDSCWGPAHIVLEDLNTEDVFLDWCIGLCESVLDHSKAKADDVEMLVKLNWYENHSLAEIADTIKFLRNLRSIPEADRLESNLGDIINVP